MFVRLRMSEKEEIVCPYVECARSFNEPIELSVIQADGSSESYRACPHCFSRVSRVKKRVERTGSSSDKLNEGLNETAPGALEKVLKVLKESANDIEKNEQAGCSHFIGYLKTRPENSPIPDECLVCAKILRCM